MERLSKWKAIIQTPPMRLPFSISLCLSLQAALVLHHLSPFIAFTIWFHLCSFFCTSPLLPHNVLLPSSSQPFIPSFLTLSFIIPPCPFPPILYSSPTLLPLLLLSSAPLNWTDHKGPAIKMNSVKHPFFFSILRLATAANWLQTE